MNRAADFSKYISVITFSDRDAEEIRRMVNGLDINIDVDITDEEYLSDVCGEKNEDGKKVFLFYGMDSRIVGLGRNICTVMIRKNTLDFLKTGMGKSGFKKAVLILYDNEYADCDFISEQWGIKVESFNMSCSESARNHFLDNADRDAVYIGSDEFSYLFRSRGFAYRRVVLSEGTFYNALKSAFDLVGVKILDEEKSRENELRIEQYKVVFNFTNDAILAIDENGVIIAANDMVYKFLKWNPEDRLEGKHIYNVVKGTKMIKAMEKDDGDIGDIFELPYGTVMTHRIPIEINGEKKGVVSTFQDLIVLQEHEKNARLSLSRNKKGFFAKYGFGDIKGSSKAISEVINIARSYAFSDSTVLILGETETGKELFAQSIHNAGERRSGPFVAVNCAAIHKDQLEAEFFGYEEGGSSSKNKGGKPGMFELAHKGTIFLDEIGDMPFEMQVQLLRVIQEKEIRRIGSDRIIPVDVRVIAATNRDLKAEVMKGNFREDLYYRLDVLEIKVPPLREREDIFDIAVDFLKAADYKCFKLNEAMWYEIIGEISKYELRGNIRELQNLLERFMVMMNNDRINTSNILTELEKGAAISRAEKKSQTRESMLYEDIYEDIEDAKQWEKRRIISALKNNGLSRSKAAKELGISRSTLWNKMKQYKIEL